MTEQIEKYLLKIRSVIGAKIITNDHNEIEEMHIVSDLRRAPKQILRDIEAIMLSEFNMPIDYKKVSIAQVKGDSIKTDQDPRVRLKSIEYSNLGSSIDVTVTLEKFNEMFSSTKTGIKTTSNVKRLAGIATLKAVEEYLGIYDVFVFEDSKEVSLSNVDVIIVTITSIYHHREELYTGTARVGTDINEAVTRATLDAVNRHILQLQSL